MSNVQFSKVSKNHELCVATMQNRIALVTKSMFYTVIFYVLFGIGGANSAWALLYSPTLTAPRIYAPPPSTISCTSPSFIKCDGTNDETCTKRCDAGQNAFPSRNTTIYNYKTSTYTTNTINNQVSATGYYIYDIICPAGYASGNPRVLAGRATYSEWATSYSDYLRYVGWGFSCVDYQPAQTFYISSGSLPAVGTDIDIYGEWIYGGWYYRLLRVTAASDATICYNFLHGFAGVCHLWGTHQCFNGYKQYRGGVPTGVTGAWYNSGGCSCWDEHSWYCEPTRYVVTGYMKICYAPFFPQGEPMIKSVCVYTGPNWKSKTAITQGTTNCVPRTTTTTTSPTNPVGGTSTTTPAASAANICPPSVTPKTPGPGSEDAPAL